MTVITLRCDKCGKSADMLYDCSMHFEKYDGVHLEELRITNSIELCKGCLEEYRHMFNKNRLRKGET